jgi:hypothetical protein
MEEGVACFMVVVVVLYPCSTGDNTTRALRNVRVYCI